MHTRRLLGSAVAGLLALGAAACGGDDESTDTTAAAPATTATTAPASTAAPTTAPAATTTAAAPATTAAASEGAIGDAAARYTTPLADVCPQKIVLQWNWWPQAEHGFSYQLIGAGGTVDTEKYTYTGPLGSTGVDLEIRAGGPATGRQLPNAQLYQDDSILLAVTSTEDSIGNSAQLPTVSVFAYNQKTPLVLFWGDDAWDFQSLADIRDSGATVSVFEGAPYVSVLTGQGLLDESQLDFSYKGDPARFIAEDGKIVQQGIVTSEIYKYEHDIAEWGKPVHYVLVGDEYPVYTSQISIRADRLEENRACLEKLVPLFQQAAVDYATDPAPTNQVLLDYVAQLDGSGWTLSAGIVEWAATQAVEQGVVANGSDGVYGSFDFERLQAFQDAVAPILTAQGKTVADGLTPEQYATNEFLDPEISL
jgi:hypothetical protein